MEGELVFIYGTLRRGCWRHDLLERLGAEYLGEAEAEGYTITVRGGAPMMVPVRGCRALGELYRVPRDALRELDEEEVTTGLYERRRIRVKAGGRAVEAWAYLGKVSERGCVSIVYTCGRVPIEPIA